jgi:hypothetical protein
MNPKCKLIYNIYSEIIYKTIMSERQSLFDLCRDDDVLMMVIDYKHMIADTYLPRLPYYR